MGKLLRYPSPHSDKNRTAYLGMALFLGGWAMTFLGLFLGYGMLRRGAPEWPPSGLPPLPLLWPGLNSLVIVASSATLELGIDGLRRRRSGQLPRWLLLTIGLGTLFLGLQYQLGEALYRQGLSIERGGYAAVFYGFTGIHALHLLVGLGALLVLLLLARRDRYTGVHHLPLRLWALYWHFVGLIWVAMYLLVFVL